MNEHERQPNPRVFTPNDTQSSPEAPELTLAESLGETVDRARQLVVDMGFRPYRVWIVTVQWEGGEIGVGESRVVAERELVPSPLVDTRPIYTESRSAGTVDQGTLRLREISPRYTEDEIWGMFRPEAGQQVFVEQRVDGRDGVTERRRFGVRGQPWRDQANMQWVVNMSTEQQARTRAGELVQATVFPERGQI